MVAALAACGPTPAAEDTVLRIGIADPVVVSNYDPRLPTFYGGDYGNQAVFDALFYRDATTVSPRVATEWSISEDGLTVSVTLRDDVQFTDGTSLDAAAVKANLEAFKAPEAGSSGGLSALAEVEVTGDYSVDLILSRPDRGLLPFIADLSLLRPEDLTAATPPEVPVGSGPYVVDVDATTAGVEYTYTRNPDYWEPERYPYDTIVVSALPDDVARLNALKSDQIDFAPIGTSYAAEAEASGLTVKASPDGWTGLVFEDRDGDVLAPIGDLRVRQAISMAFDRQAILDTIDLYGIPSNQVFAEGTPEYVADLESMYPYDPEKAKELLAEAGYPDGFDLTLAGFVGWSGYQPVVTQSLGDIGIRVTFEERQFEELWADYQAGAYPVVMISAPAAYTFPWFIQPDGLFTGNRHPDATVSALLETINGPDDEASAEASQELGTYILENALITPVGHAAPAAASTPSVTYEFRPGSAIVPLYGFGIAG